MLDLVKRGLKKLRRTQLKGARLRGKYVKFKKKGKVTMVFDYGTFHQVDYLLRATHPQLSRPMRRGLARVKVNGRKEKRREGDIVPKCIQLAVNG